MREDFAQIAGTAASLASVGSDVAFMGIQIDNKVKQDSMIAEQVAAAEAAQKEEAARAAAMNDQLPILAAFLGVPVSLSALSSCVVMLLIPVVS